MKILATDLAGEAATRAAWSNVSDAEYPTSTPDEVVVTVIGAR